MEICSKRNHGYRIKVGGHLTGSLARAFEDLVLTLTPDGCTDISGIEVDQSALFGVLIRIRDCGLTLVEVAYQESKAAKSSVEKEERNNEQL